MDALGIKCMAQVTHFIEDAAQSPYVTLVAVSLCLEELWRHVVRGTDACIGEVLGII